MTQPNEQQSKDVSHKYSDSIHTIAFSQCEILQNVFIPLVTASIENNTSTISVEQISVPFCIVMSQDCDLERDFEQYKADRGSKLRHNCYVSCYILMSKLKKLPME